MEGQPSVVRTHGRPYLYAFILSGQEAMCFLATPENAGPSDAKRQRRLQKFAALSVIGEGVGDEFNAL